MNSSWLLGLLSTVVFAVGAFAFCILALSYWRQRGTRTPLFQLFTIVCAAAFLANLGGALFVSGETLIPALQAVLASLLPPMMLHIVLGAAHSRLQRVVIPFVYAASVSLALVAEFGASDRFENSSALVLAGVAATALAVIPYRRQNAAAESRWMMAIFTALLASSVGALLSPNPLFSVAPDYLVLTFFAVRLYYTERLTFFDIFLKRAAYFCCGVALSAAVAVQFRTDLQSGHWNIPATLLLGWLVAPWVNARLSNWVDRSVLKRPYSGRNAESTFTEALQAAATEQELIASAVEHLEQIFACRAEIRTTPRISTGESGEPGGLAADIVPTGSLFLRSQGRPAPFLSDDQTLLQRLAVIFSGFLHNLRLREERQNQLLREQQLQALATRAELRALRAQIDPHFLFNSLNAVAGWIHTRPDVADETLAQLADVFRYTLRRSQTEWIRLSEELDFLRSYLSVEKARFGDRLETTMSADPAAASILIPAMLIQPLVENAIKHGTSRVTGRGVIAVEVSLLAGSLAISVADNGPGFPPELTLAPTANGNGLQNVAERLRGYYGDRGNLSWQNGAPHTRVTITIPREASTQCAS